MQHAFDKYGKESFEIDILELCNIENLNEREKHYISVYNSTSRSNGYNIELGGNNSPVSEETKNKLMLQRSSRNIEDIIAIKKDLYLGVPRKTISEKYNISKCNLDAIAQLSNYKTVVSELNEGIIHKKKKKIDARNDKILQMLRKGYGNKQISKDLQVPISVVEKVKYKYPDVRFKDKNIRINNYNRVKELKAKGYKPCDIIKILGISSSVVYRYYKDEVNPNSELSYSKVNDEMKSKIIKLSDNYNCSEIEKMIGISRTTIKNVLDNYKYANTEVIN